MGIRGGFGAAAVDQLYINQHKFPAKVFIVRGQNVWSLSTGLLVSFLQSKTLLSASKGCGDTHFRKYDTLKLWLIFGRPLHFVLNPHSPASRVGFVGEVFYSLSLCRNFLSFFQQTRLGLRGEGLGGYKWST